MSIILDLLALKLFGKKGHAQRPDMAAAGKLYYTLALTFQFDMFYYN